MSGPHRPAPTATGTPLRRHLRRAAGTDGNPLSRPVDRARSRAVLLAALGIALAVPAGAGAALADLGPARQQAAADAAHRHRLDALVLAPARQVTSALDPGADLYRAPAAWVYPAGRQHTATLDLPAPTAAGATATVWVGDGGEPASAPPTAGDVAMETACVGVVTAVCLAVVTASGLGLRLRHLDRRAEESWERSWERLEPVWTGRAAR